MRVRHALGVWDGDTIARVWPSRVSRPQWLDPKYWRLRARIAAARPSVAWRLGRAAATIPGAVVDVVIPEVAGLMEGREADRTPARTGTEGTGEAAPRIVRDPRTAAGVQPGERVWLDSAELLRYLPARARVQVLRASGGVIGSELLRSRVPGSRRGVQETPRVETNVALIANADRIVTLSQHPWEPPVEWAQALAERWHQRLAAVTEDLPLAPLPRPPVVSSRPEVTDIRMRTHLPDVSQPVVLARPLGVFLHLYHAELAEVFARRLEWIDHPYLLYVSTDTQEKARRIGRQLPHAHIIVSPNRGRDIRPKLYDQIDAYDDHDVVLHLHGKRSPHARELDAWLADILGAIMNSPGSIRTILSIFRDVPSVGVVAPPAFPTILPSYNWKNNLVIAQIYGWSAALPTLPADGGMLFPAGSMFWARTEVLRPLLDLRLRPDEFPPEAGQTDGTLAHALERLVGAGCIVLGRDYVAFDGRTPQTSPEWRTFQDASALRAHLDGHRMPRR